ncbi:MAG: GIY-YIG nuclease family protein [Patescibacteria group bacterium]|nr:GIY-YIG nuclease family protein [Patescibacteria group bacterium]
MERMVGFNFQWFVYIVGCQDKSYYCGLTTNLPDRLIQHNLGSGSKYTSTRFPVRLLWSREFGSERDARGFEHKIKRWRRQKKEQLMRGLIYNE